MRATKSRVLAPALAALVALCLPAAAGAGVPEGAEWTEATIASSDGVRLHADILRPTGLPEDAKTPVILSVGPYFNHSGQVGPAGPVINAPYDPVGPSTGPSERFYDLIEGARLMERGYSFVMVDIRGFGGSTGCLDWVGPGEQADVVHAVEWAASQPWSNGKVGMYGKSYDASTGLVGVNLQPEGLAAVVAQQPVYDMYRYLYGDGIRRLNSIATPALYEVIDLTPGTAADTPRDPMYQVDGANDTQRPGCKALNLTDQAADDDHFSRYWRARDLIPGAKGSDVPLFLTAGLPENNTVSDGLAQYMQNHTGPERAWLGPWDHVRGNEVKNGRLQMGREGFFDEVMRFYDEHLKGTEPAVEDPRVVVQTYDGAWRPEASWPPADAERVTTPVKGGTYEDDGQGQLYGGASARSGIWTISKPLPHDAHLAGSGRAVLDVVAPPRSNLSVAVYEVDPDGVATLITRQAHLLRQNGRYTLDLWSADYKIPAGHRIAVRLTDADTDHYTLTVGTQQDVEVLEASVELPFLAQRRTETTHGQPSATLSTYTGRTVTLPEAMIAANESADFVLPPAQADPAAGTTKAKRGKRPGTGARR